MDDRPPRTRRTRDELRDLVTDWLDVLGLLALAVGLAWGLWPHVGGFSILAGGAVVLAGSAFAAWRASVAAQPAVDESPARARTPRRPRAPGTPRHRFADVLHRGRPALAAVPDSGDVA